MTTKLILRFKGGPGSGHKGHRGRPGKQGGGLPDDESAAPSPAASNKPIESVSESVIRHDNARRRDVEEALGIKKPETTKSSYKFSADERPIAVSFMEQWVDDHVPYSEFRGGYDEEKVQDALYAWADKVGIDKDQEFPEEWGDYLEQAIGNLIGLRSEEDLTPGPWKGDYDPTDIEGNRNRASVKRLKKILR